jgi:hypothetical protein
VTYPKAILSDFIQRGREMKRIVAILLLVLALFMVLTSCETTQPKKDPLWWYRDPYIGPGV